MSFELFILIAAIWGYFSIPLTKFLTNDELMGILETTWYFKFLRYVLGFALLFFLAWPIRFAAVWMESNQNKYPPFDLHLGIKGGLVMICWMIFTLQLFYRMGFAAGNRSKNK